MTQQSTTLSHLVFRLRNKLACSCKADTPGPWYQDAKTLELLLRGAWDEVSKDFLEEMRSRLENLDPDGMEALLNTANSLGVEMSKIIGDKAEAILTTLQTKANAAWILHAEDMLNGETVKTLDEQYQKYLSQMTATQIKKFSEEFPKRILHPEVNRQIQYLRDSDLTRSIDLDTLNERLTRFVKQERYWENLSDVQVARQWHANGILLGQENGIKTGQITGPDDEKTCPVCDRMLGMKVDIADAAAKIKRDISIADPEKYVEAWPFPRILQIDNESRESIESMLLLPPYHGRCRHTVVWLSR